MNEPPHARDRRDHSDAARHGRRGKAPQLHQRHPRRARPTRTEPGGGGPPRRTARTDPPCRVGARRARGPARARRGRLARRRDRPRRAGPRRRYPRPPRRQPALATGCLGGPAPVVLRVGGRPRTGLPPRQPRPRHRDPRGPPPAGVAARAGGGAHPGPRHDVRRPHPPRPRRRRRRRHHGAQLVGAAPGRRCPRRPAADLRPHPRRRPGRLGRRVDRPGRHPGPQAARGRGRRRSRAGGARAAPDHFGGARPRREPGRQARLGAAGTGPRKAAADTRQPRRPRLRRRRRGRRPGPHRAQRSPRRTGGLPGRHDPHVARRHSARRALRRDAERLPATPRAARRRPAPRGVPARRGRPDRRGLPRHRDGVDAVRPAPARPTRHGPVAGLRLRRQAVALADHPRDPRQRGPPGAGAGPPRPRVVGRHRHQRRRHRRRRPRPQRVAARRLRRGVCPARPRGARLRRTTGGPDRRPAARGLGATGHRGGADLEPRVTPALPRHPDGEADTDPPRRHGRHERRSSERGPRRRHRRTRLGRGRGDTRRHPPRRRPCRAAVGHRGEPGVAALRLAPAGRAGRRTHRVPGPDRTGQQAPCRAVPQEGHRHHPPRCLGRRRRGGGHRRREGHSPGHGRAQHDRRRARPQRPDRHGVDRGCRQAPRTPAHPGAGRRADGRHDVRPRPRR